VKPELKYSGGSCLISGQLLFDTLDSLANELLTEAGKAGEMTIDLKNIANCDSAFVALLAACLQIKTLQGQSMKILNSPEKLLNMLEVYGLLNCGWLTKKAI